MSLLYTRIASEAHTESNWHLGQLLPRAEKERKSTHLTGFDIIITRLTTSLTLLLNQDEKQGGVWMCISLIGVICSFCVLRSLCKHKQKDYSLLELIQVKWVNVFCVFTESSRFNHWPTPSKMSTPAN